MHASILPPVRICTGCGEAITHVSPKDVFIPSIGAMKICDECYKKIEAVLPKLKENVAEETIRIRNNWRNYGHNYTTPKKKLKLNYRPAENKPEEIEQTPQGG